MTDDFDAKEAADHCLRPVARFTDLSPGEQFRFPGMQRRMIRTKRGYRRQDQAHEYKTGAKTAVIPLEAMS